MSAAYLKLARILNTEEEVLRSLDAEMSRAFGREGILDAVLEKNREMMDRAIRQLNTGPGSADHVRGILRQAIVKHEKTLLEHLNQIPDHDEFGRMAVMAEKMVKTNHGYFLNKELIADILRKRPPQNLLKYLGYSKVEDLIAKEDLTECMSALRFVETNEWMHETFELVYSGFGADDFEERRVELRVLGPKWREISKKFVAKKHHNVSHLKEFGVIFLNPIRENIPGKFLRDFALLLHYFHEVQFYSKLFQKYFGRPNFAEHFKSLLRGDVEEKNEVKKGEWLIVQRYLWKENPADPRLKLPRVNPESLHWARGERDLAAYMENTAYCDFGMWGGLDWVGGLFPGEGGEELVSFDLEDNAMSLVSFMEGRQEFFTYHQREALWTKIFSEYVGGEEEMEKILLANFEKGRVSF
jgi:hypothetical protein